MRRPFGIHFCSRCICFWFLCGRLGRAYRKDRKRRFQCNFFSPRGFTWSIIISVAWFCINFTFSKCASIKCMFSKGEGNWVLIETTTKEILAPYLLNLRGWNDIFLRYLGLGAGRIETNFGLCPLLRIGSFWVNVITIASDHEAEARLNAPKFNQFCRESIPRSTIKLMQAKAGVLPCCVSSLLSCWMIVC